LAELQTFFDGRLPRFAQILFATGFYHRWSTLTKSDSIPERQQSIIPSLFFWGDMIKIRMHWLLIQEVDSYYSYYGVVATTANKLHKWTREIERKKLTISLVHLCNLLAVVAATPYSFLSFFYLPYIFLNKKNINSTDRGLG
jgi:hypothetical protein